MSGWGRAWSGVPGCWAAWGMSGRGREGATKTQPVGAAGTNAMSFFCFNLSNYLVEAESKKKKMKLPGPSEGGEADNQEGPAEGTPGALQRPALPRLGEEEAPQGPRVRTSEACGRM